MKIKFFILAIAVLLLGACSENFLDMKRDKKMVVPSTVEDFEAMLDFTNLMNKGSGYLLGILSTDDYYLTTERWKQLASPFEKNTYIWDVDIFEGQQSFDWNKAYARILNANLAIEGLDAMETSVKNGDYWKEIKGRALFHRSYAFYLLVTLFSDTYKPETADSDLGIPLRISSDISVTYKRATVKETYEKILEDLKISSYLLSSENSNIKTRPSKGASYGLMARCYLQMEDYKKAEAYADSSLLISSQLMDYNEYNMSSTTPFPRYNIEVIFSDLSSLATPMLRTRLNVDSLLYDSYEDVDLRKDGYFFINSGNLTFKGSYDASQGFFIGLTVGEMLLIRAECNVRLGNASGALADLNYLLKNRYMANEFNEVVFENAETLLDKILLEKRKELVFRGVRWSELKRLNKDDKRSKILKRIIDGVVFELKPGDKRYIFPIPDNVIELSNIEQNLRF